MDKHSTAYRADIDGLRAIAVLLVVLYHAQLGPFKGGFVGVDVFFVISGYLVGGQLLRELEQSSRLDILGFYKRRCLRIVPALVVLILLVAGFGFWVVAPLSLVRLGDSVTACALSVGNFFFGQKRGYFDSNARNEPLLHLWSLAVEEQFYLLLPPLLLALRKFRVKLSVGLWVLTGVSLIWSIWSLRISIPAAYFGLPSRFWELAFGVVLHQVLVKKPISQKYGSLLGGLGLVLIFGSALLLKGSLGFPGWRAIPVVFGSGLCLAVGSHSRVGKLLELGPLVYLGRCSYSLYLVHWPLIVWTERYLFWMSSPWLRVGVVAVSIALSMASYRWIETPFRRQSWRDRPSPRILAATASCLLVLAVSGQVLKLVAENRRSHPGNESRVQLLVGYSASPEWRRFIRRGDCLLLPDTGEHLAANCFPSDKSTNAALIIGDSYAAQIWRELQDQYPGVSLGQASASGNWDLASTTPRIRNTLASIDKYLEANHPKWIAISLKWSPGQSELLRFLASRYRSRCDALIVIGRPPEYTKGLPLLLEAKELFGEAVPKPSTYLTAEPLAVEKELAETAANLKVPFFSVQRTLCGDSTPRDCRVVADDGLPVQIDKGHLSPSGAKIVVRAFREQFPDLAGAVETASTNRLE